MASIMILFFDTRCFKTNLKHKNKTMNDHYTKNGKQKYILCNENFHLVKSCIHSHVFMATSWHKLHFNPPEEASFSTGVPQWVLKYAICPIKNIVMCFVLCLLRLQTTQNYSEPPRLVKLLDRCGHSGF